MAYHIPVLLREISELWPSTATGWFVDGTLGHAGHSVALLERCPDLSVVGVDVDERNLVVAQDRLALFGERVRTIHASYERLDDLVGPASPHHPVVGCLLDLGFSSAHVDEAERGFSFLQEGPLDMRFDATTGITASELLISTPEAEIARWLRVYGEELKAGPIARVLKEASNTAPIETTTQLAALVETIVPRRGKIHPATKTFQALRIAVNDELGALNRFLAHVESWMAPASTLAIISFHSLEDGTVKRWGKATTAFQSCTAHPIVPSDEEVKRNPRARSAKLRLFTRL